MSNDQIALGDIVATHGVAGWLRLRLFNPQGRTLYSVDEVHLACGKSRRSFEIDRARPHKRLVLVKLRGIDDMDAAQALVGCRVSVAQDRLAPLEPLEFYYAEVVGFEVVDAGGERIGTVSRIWATEGGDLLVVDGSGKGPLIPAIREFIRHIDVVEKTVTVDVPEGLLEL